MFKFLLVIGLVLYVIYKIGTLFFRAGAASQQFRNQHQQRNPQNAQTKKNSDFKGGEYIDYEEVK
jgi:uncharacterized protein HemY